MIIENSTALKISKTPLITDFHRPKHSLLGPRQKRGRGPPNRHTQTRTHTHKPRSTGIISGAASAHVPTNIKSSFRQESKSEPGEATMGPRRRGTCVHVASTILCCTSRVRRNSLSWMSRGFFSAGAIFDRATKRVRARKFSPASFVSDDGSSIRLRWVVACNGVIWVFGCGWFFFFCGWRVG